MPFPLFLRLLIGQCDLMLSGSIATFCVAVRLTPPDSLNMDEIILKSEFQHFKIFTVGLHSDILKLRQKNNVF